MPDVIPRWLALLHPLLSVVALTLLAAAASLGLRSRERGGAALRPRQASLAPWAFALTAANSALGVLSTWLWRPELELAGGWHFRLGAAILLLLAGGAALSRRLPHSERARLLHPLLGLGALLLALVQVFFGLSLLPP